jgi:hypothetical protein
VAAMLCRFDPGSGYNEYLKMIYHILDIFFIVFHTSIVIFNLFGWMLRRTRLLNLIILLLTGSSWLFLGLIVGTLGFCPFTEWHFNVLEKLGRTGLPNSYIKYLIDRITGYDINEVIVDKVTLYSFLAALAISITLNILDLKKKRK